MKKARITITQAISNTMIVMKLSKKVVKPSICDAWSSSGHAAVKPVPASLPGFRRSSAVIPQPPAVSPSPANAQKQITARDGELPRLKATAPTKTDADKNGAERVSKYRNGGNPKH